MVQKVVLIGGVYIKGNTKGLRLMPRARQTLCLAAFSDREIARQFGITWHSVKNIWSRDIYPIMRRVAQAAGMDWPESRHLRTMAVWVAVNCGVIEICELHPGERRMHSEEVY